MHPKAWMSLYIYIYIYIYIYTYTYNVKIHGQEDGLFFVISKMASMIICFTAKALPKHSQNHPKSNPPSPKRPQHHPKIISKGRLGGGQKQGQNNPQGRLGFSQEGPRAWPQSVVPKKPQKLPTPSPNIQQTSRPPPKRPSKATLRVLKSNPKTTHTAAWGFP